VPLERAITHVNDDTLRELILSAKRRVVAVSPAFSKIVAEAIAVQWKRLGASAVSVILDSDPEVYRLGYGHLEGLEILEKAADSQEPPASLARQQGIRIAL